MHKHSHTMAFRNSEMGVTVIPQLILHQPTSCSYFCPLSVCLRVGKYKKAEHMLPHQKCKC